MNKLHVFSGEVEFVGDLQGYGGLKSAREIADMVKGYEVGVMTLCMVEPNGELTALADFDPEEGEFHLVNAMPYGQRL